MKVRLWRRSGLIATFEDLDDDHGAAAARAQLSFGLVGRIVGRRGGDVEQTAGAFEMILAPRSEEHTSELQSLMRISYAVLGLNKKYEQLTLPSPTAQSPTLQNGTNHTQ